MTTVSIPITDDTVFEPDEIFYSTLIILGHEDVVITQDTAEVLILYNDRKCDDDLHEQNR